MQNAAYVEKRTLYTTISTLWKVGTVHPVATWEVQSSIEAAGHLLHGRHSVCPVVIHP